MTATQFLTVRGARAWLLALAAALTLSACGFHLRGSDGSYNLPFATVYIGLPEASPLAINLKRTIRSIGGTEIVADAKLADGVIEVLTDPDKTRGKSVLSINSNGRVLQYLLSYTIQFRVTDKDGKQLLAPTSIALTRPIDFNDSQLLAKESEEALLYRDMQTDMVQQMIRRVAALKSVVTPISTPPAVPATTPVATPVVP
ncbi:LPS-assembly lipoprotein [Oxalobacteraceae bacterium GrIS 1.11]